ncbi:VOC family protein [Herpetosiphon sp. NSE202]|uniref:VOC family protein n=1 Tax=Herpetosiphon sp. NSE202 TaxID=3351349 RepID=UPI003629BF1F
MQLIALDHIQLAMPAEQEAQARWFYSTILGLDEVAKPAPLQARGGCWFRGSNIELHLGVEADFRPARKAHPAFRVADLAQARAELQAVGIAIVEDSSLPHVRRFYAADPFGNRLEFVQLGDVY